ncbi:MAG: aminotransferase class V-fold PLP-dependent enzyme [Bacteroidota bacterium]
MNRKTFVRIGAAAAGAMLMPPFAAGTAAASPPPWPSGDPADESFWEFLREQFPLERDRAYLNTGGLGASPYAVIDAVTTKMRELERISETGRDEQLWKEIKTDIASLLGCGDDEVAFTRNTTEGINIVANGLPLRSGDEVILTTHEHVGNALPWLALARRTGVVLRLFEPSIQSQQENLDRIAALFSKRTRLISVPHAVTTTGLILPVRDIATMARARNIWFFVDGAQTAGMFPFSLHEIGCDAYATSGHKWLMGPKETGVLYVRRAMLDTVRATSVGAYSDGGFDFLKGTLAFHPSAQRYEYGTVNVPLRVGLWEAVRFIRRIGIRQVWERDRMLSTRLYRGLREIPGVRVHSPEADDMRSAMITFSHEALPHLELQNHLTTYNLRTRPVGEGGMAALRVSTHIYNMPDEVDRVLEGVKTATTRTQR